MPTIYTSDKDKLPGRKKHEVYETPYPVIANIYNHKVVQDIFDVMQHRISDGEEINVLDVGAGDGRWGEWLKAYLPDINLTGIDIRDLEKPDAYDNWIVNDFLEHTFDPGQFHLVIGNPPYLRKTKDMIKLVKKSHWVTNISGYTMLLLKMDFLHGKQRYEQFFTTSKNRLKHILFSPKRIQWYGKSTNGDLHGFMVWIPYLVRKTQFHWLNYIEE